MYLIYYFKIIWKGENKCIDKYKKKDLYKMIKKRNGNEEEEKEERIKIIQ